jgi:hypothetical protein
MEVMPYQPASLASTTNTRVETAARHMQQCRIATDDMIMFVDGDALELQRNKYRYCIHKDELVVGLGRPWSAAENIRRTSSKSAYPPVISNLGKIDDVAKNMLRYMHHNASTIQDRETITRVFSKSANNFPSFAQATPESQRFFTEEQKEKVHSRLGQMYDLFSVGVANTLGWAHPNTGDTMVAVMIGGLRTIQNGDFEIYTGDLVQYYWPFEKDDFKQDGSRKPRCVDDHGNLLNLDPSTQATGEVTHPAKTQRKMDFHDRQYGNRGKGEEKLVAKIKPYVHDYESPRMYDQRRVIGVAICYARPGDMVDIKIQRQAV